MKNFLSTRKQKAVLCVVIAFLTCIAIGLIAMRSDEKPKAESVTETIEQKIVRLTDSDYLDGDNTTTIRDFAEKYKKGEYRPSGYDEYVSYPVTDIVDKVIPIEFCCEAGTHIYMGQEYGFIIHTYSNDHNVSFYSFVLIIDFTVSGKSSDIHPYYRIEPIVQLDLRAQNENGKWEILFSRYGSGTEIYLKNIFIAASLENENELNAYDVNYNKSNDDGDLILTASLDYSAHHFIHNADYETLTEWAVKKLVTKGLNIVKDADIPLLSDAVGLTMKAISFFKDTSQYIELAGNVFTKEDEIHTTIGNAGQKIFNFPSKKEQVDSDEYDSYSREVYLAQDDIGADIAEFLAGYNSD